MTGDTPDNLRDWLAPFGLDEFLRGEVTRVLASLPAPVREGLVGDPYFMLCDYEPGAGVVMRVPVRLPGGRSAGGAPAAGRSVVLKRTLRNRPGPFVRWVIAHELAHAHLRHGGRWPGEDPEHAADALAAEWGFPRPR